MGGGRNRTFPIDKCCVPDVFVIYLQILGTGLDTVQGLWVVTRTWNMYVSVLKQVKEAQSS